MSFSNVSASACKKMMDEQSGDMIVLDVRSKEEFDKGRIEGAKHIPLDELRARIEELPRDKDICVYCASGNRSQTACTILSSHGFAKCMNLDGGIFAWRREGFDII